MHQDLQKILINSEQIEKRVKELGEEITRDYKGESVLMVAILRGAVVFFADLVKSVDLDVRFDFMVVSSYGSSSTSSGEGIPSILYCWDYYIPSTAKKTDIAVHLLF